MNLNLKKTLKIIKLNESSISLFLGILVLITVASLAVKFIKNSTGKIPEELLTETNSIEATQKTHRVEKDENLWNIAVKYYGDGFKWVDIATENKLANASIIEEGQELVIPNLDDETADKTNTIDSSTYEVQKGDNLWDIAVRAYGDGYKWLEIAKANNLIHPNLIHSGNILVLPR